MNRITRQSGFTLIELLVSISIIAMLATLASPVLGSMIDRAKSVSCGSKLRQIGVATQLFAQENDNRIPTIEGFPSDPIYDGPMAKEAQTLIEALGPYGVTESGLRCPSDKKYFAEEGTSYMWRPTVDDELINNPKVISRRSGGERTISPRFASICSDFDAIHGSKGQGRSNRVYLDGHVAIYY